MSQTFLSIFVILLLVSCQNETVPPDASGEDMVESRAPRDRIKVCHYDEETNTWQVMHIPVNAWPAHEAHGDILGDCPEEEEEVIICDQVWMLRNLDVTTYRNGDPIPQVTDPAEWQSLTTGAWCYYNNDAALGDIYGKLYNWYAVNDPRGLAPAGWHIPSNAEWTVLAECLGGEDIAGGPMKATGNVEDGTGLWASPNLGATNSSGFTGLPGGFRESNGVFGSNGIGGLWWSTTEQNTSDAWYRIVLYANEYLFNTFISKRDGMSVRCIRD